MVRFVYPPVASLFSLSRVIIFVKGCFCGGHSLLSKSSYLDSKQEKGKINL